MIVAASNQNNKIDAAGALYLRALTALLRGRGVTPYLRMLASCPHNSIQAVIIHEEQAGHLTPNEATAIRNDINAGVASRANIEYFFSQLQAETDIVAWKSHLSRSTSIQECIKSGGIIVIDVDSTNKKTQLSMITAEIEHVWTHTMMVADVAVKYREKANNPLGFMLSTITHDFGKALCTEIVNGEIHAYNHEMIGLPLVESFMKRLTTEKSLIEYVMNLSELHMKPNMLAADNSAIKSTNKLFDQSVDPGALVYLAISDGLGKIAHREYISYDDFFAKRLDIFREYMSRPYVMGRDLIAAGISPSERFSEYLEYAHKLRLAGVEKENALRQTLALARKKGDYERADT